MTFYAILHHSTPLYTILQAEGLRGDTNEPIKLSDARAEKRHRQTNKAVRRRGLHHSAPFYTILQHFTPFYTILQTEGLRGDTDEPIKFSDKEAERGHRRTNKAVRRKGSFPFYTILHHSTPFYTISYNSIPFHAILHHSSNGGAERGHRRTNIAVRLRG